MLHLSFKIIFKRCINMHMKKVKWSFFKKYWFVAAIVCLYFAYFQEILDCYPFVGLFFILWLLEDK